MGSVMVVDVGGDQGFREFVAARRPALLRTASMMTGNPADAEDLVQSVLAKTYLAWDRIKDRAALDGYVRRTMVNTHISGWRRRRVEEYPTDEIPDRPAAEPPPDTDQLDALRRAIGRLPHRMQAVVLLRYYEDRSEAEIAAALGVSAGTVKSTVSRAMAKLRADAELVTPGAAANGPGDVSRRPWQYPPQNRYPPREHSG